MSISCLSHVHCLLGLKNMTTYKRVKPATTGPVANINKLKMICLFYFVLKSEKRNSHNVGTAVVPEKLFYFFPFLFFFYFNSKCEFELIFGLIHPAIH